MNFRFLRALSIFWILTSCSHKTESQSAPRMPTSISGQILQSPAWENDICLMKGEHKGADYIVRFHDLKNLCPARRDYASVKKAYLQLKNRNRGVFLPQCRAQPGMGLSKNCWMGNDVFGENNGSCVTTEAQSVCSQCQCGSLPGVVWN
jgi:hypothetical protein